MIKRIDEAAAIRDDVDAEDLLRAVSGICMAADSPGWAELAGPLIDLLAVGLGEIAGVNP